MKKDYIPALINLTVVYERNGRKEKAAQFAADANGILRVRLPIAKYNHAWYLSIDNKTAEVTKILKPLADLKINDKYSTLLDINRRKNSLSAKFASFKAAVSENSFSKKGIFGSIGLLVRWYIIIPYLFILLGFSKIIYKFFSTKRAFFALFPLVGLLHVLCWGMPQIKNGWMFLGISLVFWNFIMLYLFRGAK